MQAGHALCNLTFELCKSKWHFDILILAELVSFNFLFFKFPLTYICIFLLRIQSSLNGHIQ